MSSASSPPSPSFGRPGPGAGGAKLRTLEAGDVPYYEPNLDSELAAQKAAGRLRFTGTASQALPAADMILICVGTPSDASGHADPGAALAVADAIANTVDG